MNEEKDQKPDGGGSSFMRGCGIAVGVVALVFFFILGTCFLG